MIDRRSIHALGGSLLALTATACGPASKPRTPDGTGNAASGAVIFRRCAACHTIGRYGTDTDGPNLYGVVGAPVAARRPRFAYTAALQATGGVWDAARLDAWLADPRKLVPGTTMAFAGLHDARERRDVIAYLVANSPATPTPR